MQFLVLRNVKFLEFRLSLLSFLFNRKFGLVKLLS